jgi:hypothetical protein
MSESSESVRKFSEIVGECGEGFGKPGMCSENV